MEWIKWVFEGIGTAIISAFVGYYFGRKGSATYVNALTIKQTQNQNAGDGAQLIQINGNPTINLNSSEYARIIFQKQSKFACKELTIEACQKADERLKFLEELLMSRLEQIPNSFHSFADPAFQDILRLAQYSAAATEREIDYSLLAELLVCFIQVGENRVKRAGIYRASEIIGRIDYNALFGLTIAHAIETYLPKSCSPKEGIEAVNALFCKLLYQELPSGCSWQEHMDLIGAMRLTSFIHGRLVIGIYNSRMGGYLCVGIQKNSDDYNKAVSLLESVGLSKALLVPNDFLDGYVKLPVTNERAIDDMQFISEKEHIDLNSEQKDICRQIWKMYIRNYTIHQQAQDNFLKLWDSFECLRNVRIWWERIFLSFEITSTGRYLAHANALRCDPSLLNDLEISGEEL